MKSVLKNIGIIVVGIIIGMIINMGIIILGATIFPMTENFEPMNAMSWDLKYFIFPFIFKRFYYIFLTTWLSHGLHSLWFIFIYLR